MKFRPGCEIETVLVSGHSSECLIDDPDFGSEKERKKKELYSSV